MSDNAGEGQGPAPGSRMANVLAGVAIFYLLVVVGLAGYLLVQGYLHAAFMNDFLKLVVAALIAVLGSGLTVVGTMFGASRQSATAYEVQSLTTKVSREIAELSSKTTKDIAAFNQKAGEDLAAIKASSDEALARLKASLDAERVAYTELYGSATVYFHALRSIALGTWQDVKYREGEIGMVSATRHLLYVNQDMRSAWFNLWQRGQDIYLRGLDVQNTDDRPARLRELFKETISVEGHQLDFRAMEQQVEQAAKKALEKVR